ncbi:hypothetical protein [Thermocrispum agreste]|uniref:hypothetical protein n=1 Tax=Thermocrispum agreste TaxID=37925 RepID=UPI00048DC483|nr:hypothetical protein [Thermocrispum agreste]
MNWLVPLVMVMALAPIAACVWWWQRSRQEERRKAAARAKMTSYLQACEASRADLRPVEAGKAGRKTVKVGKADRKVAEAGKPGRKQVAARKPATSGATRKPAMSGKVSAPATVGTGERASGPSRRREPSPAARRPQRRELPARPVREPARHEFPARHDRPPVREPVRPARQMAARSLRPVGSELATVELPREQLDEAITRRVDDVTRRIKPRRDEDPSLTMITHGAQARFRAVSSMTGLR